MTFKINYKNSIDRNYLSLINLKKKKNIKTESKYYYLNKNVLSNENIK